MNEKLIVQLHHQFKDGKTDMKMQVGLTNNDYKYDKLREYAKEAREAYPLPKDAQWLFVQEDSPLFVRMWEEGDKE